MILLDGKTLAAEMRQQLAADIAALKKARGVVPGLAVVLVGEDPASQVYVRNKSRDADAVGMQSFQHTLPVTTTQADLLALVATLNDDPAVHGILVQLPLPAHIDTQTVLQAISPAKDADGFHPVNVGKLSIGLPGLVPCTPQGCLRLLKRYVAEPLAGKHAVVIGRSNIVGKPVAALLLQQDCTVTIAHSRTKNLPDVVRGADIVVAAIGKPAFVRTDWVKEGAIVLDVGINRIAKADGKHGLCGDVDYAALTGKVSAMTPVPGGVGPMTVACLLQNTYQACLTLV